jgi:hypothetical protein
MQKFQPQAVLFSLLKIFSALKSGNSSLAWVERRPPNLCLSQFQDGPFTTLDSTGKEAAWVPLLLWLAGPAPDGMPGALLDDATP